MRGGGGGGGEGGRESGGTSIEVGGVFVPLHPPLKKNDALQEKEVELVCQVDGVGQVQWTRVRNSG